MGQWRFRQGVERAPTDFAAVTDLAAVAGQSAGLPPTHDVATVAMGATDAVHPAMPTLGHNIHIGYYAQNQAETLDPKLTLLETMERQSPPAFHELCTRAPKVF